jgi:alpha-tubulin suppressor-like RCC1 family protein
MDRSCCHSRAMPTRFPKTLLAILLLAGSGCSSEPTVEPIPARLAIQSTLPGSALSGVPLSVQPIIQLQDAAGQPVARRGVMVTATLGAGTGSLTGTTGVRTEADGRAVFTDLAIAGPIGAKVLRFQATGLASVNAATIDLQAGPATVLSIAGGNGQTAVAATVLPIAPQVLVADGAGNPVAGRVVTFQADSDAVISSGTATSDQNGIARIATWQLGSRPGVYTLKAESPGLQGSPVTFVATATNDPDAPFVQSGNGQQGVVGVALGQAIVARITQGGVPQAGVTLKFTVTSGGGSFDQTDVVTDANGRAQAIWTLGPAEGLNTATVSAVGKLPSDVRATAVAFKYVTAGWRYACGLLTTGKAYCWGENGLGQLGDGTFTDRSVAVAVAGNLVFDSLEAAGNGNFTCGITPQRTTHCWGSNGHGQLGIGTNTGSGGTGGTGIPTPVTVTGGHQFRNIRLGGDHACATTDAGAGYCWGRNAFAELGNGSLSGDVFQPGQVSSGLLWNHIATGDQHSCGASTSGPAYCWGSNGSTRLGAGTSASSSAVPLQVTGGLAFTQLSAGTISGCGLVAAGSAYCWGGGTSGQIGNGAFASRPAPTLVSGGHTFLSLSAKGNAHCAVRADRAVLCWGENTAGQAGIGITGDIAVPTPVAGTFTAAMVATGLDSGCLLTVGGAIYCWGPNANGQVGNGTQVQQPFPVPVRF